MFSRAFSSILVKISSFGIRAYNRDKITLSGILVRDSELFFAYQNTVLESSFSMGSIWVEIASIVPITSP